MIIKKIFSCCCDAILSNVRKLRRFYYRHIKCQSIPEPDLEFYHHSHSHNQELTTYYVLANGENEGEGEGDDIPPPPAIYPLTSSYIQNKYPVLYNPLWNRNNLGDGENQLGYIENDETGETGENRKTPLIRNNSRDIDNSESDRGDEQILSILDKLKQQNQELLQYLPSIPRIHP